LALVAVLAANLGTLAWFKYAGFLSASAHAVTPWIPVISVGVALPLGISFFVFQKIAFAVDAYYGRAKSDHLARFLLFVMFFPQLIAGPIVHYRDIGPQLTRFVMDRQSNLARGLFIFSVGLAMKVIMADPLSPYVRSVFDHSAEATFLSAWIATAAFTCQLYFDFAGYGVMAVGLGLMFGILLPFNFESPYKATSIIEFWRRWNITLSQFLRDYLYVPLGGNRHGYSRTFINLMVTMLLGGLWHGAGWTYVVWGGLHGLYLSLAHAARVVNLRIPVPVGWGLTFFGVMVSWVFFRAPDLHAAVHLLKIMVNPVPVSAVMPPPEVLATLVLGGVIVLAAPNARMLAERFQPTWPWAFLCTLTLTAGFVRLFYAGDVHEFIYFRF
jgi:alginate O-acetyltransferase complex protein AlgI